MLRAVIFLLVVAQPNFVAASQDFTSTSSAVAIIQSLSPVVAQITKNIEVQKSLEGAGLSAKLPSTSERESQYGIEGGHITTAGTIVAHNSKYRVLVVMEPMYKGGTVAWACKVVPVTSAPKACR